jgi:3-isopropylmalate dehydrogenase
VSRSHDVFVIGGDGIGPEVVDAAIPVVEAALSRESAAVSISWYPLPYGAEHYLKTGETLPDQAFARLRDDADAILLGALGDPRIPTNIHARDILLGLRFRLDLYVNFRPCGLLHPSLCPLRDSATGVERTIDMVIFRENTEGSYLGRGRASAEGTDEEEQIVEEVHTAPKVSRLLRAAFEWAAKHGKQLVTVSDKSNAIPGHRIWRRIAEKVSQDFPGVELEFYYVDALAMDMVRNPERFQVIATSNLFGDILSDLGSQLVGGLGVAASANLHPGRPGLFEPVHGSAPPLVGTGQANPLATVLTAGLMLQELELPAAAAAVQHAVSTSIHEGVTTPDLGGRATTVEVSAFLADVARG